MSLSLFRLISKISGPLLSVLLFFYLTNKGWQKGESVAACLLLWMGIWWLTEAVSIYITALLPLLILPLTGTNKMKEVAPHYMNEIIFLFIGGFLFAYALEKWKLHNRIALRIILWVGSTPARVLLGIMLAAYFISMWINNTATTAMLIPATLAIVGQMERKNSSSGLASPFLLGLAYASSIGGMATLIGTAPNMIFFKMYNDAFPGTGELNFASWLIIGVPISLLLLTAAYFILRLIYKSPMAGEPIDMHHCRREYKELGKISFEEKWLIFFFFLLLFLWLFLNELQLGSVTIPGWPSLLGIEAKVITESWVAMVVAFLMFFIPSRIPSENLLSWEQVKRLPLGIIFLFGGGFALSGAVETSGFGLRIGEALSSYSDQSPFVIVLLLCVGVSFLTEFTSNTACLQLLLPLLIPFVQQLDVNPLVMLVPVTLSASCGFMMPVATPPNTLVFGTERIPQREMVRAGFLLDIAGVAIIFLAAFSIVKWVF